VFVLISGGAGFIGCRLGAILADAGHRVVAFDSLHPQVHTRPGVPKDLHPDVSLHCGDVTCAADWDRLFSVHGLPDVVVHLAAETGTGQSLREASRHSTTNVVGATQLCDALARHEHRPDHVLLTSSRAVYGEGAWRTGDGTVDYPPPRSEEQLAAALWDPVMPAGVVAHPIAHRSTTTWPRPSNVYAATKLAQEHVLEAWCTSFSVPLSILRLQNVYGPGQAVGNSYTGVLTFFARQLVNGRILDVYEDGHIVRDFVFIDDVVRALTAAIERTPKQLRRLDIGSGHASTLLDVALAMSSISGGPPPVVSGSFRHGDVRAAYADISDAASQLNWAPQTSLDDGLAALLAWVQSEVT
jgi:dTDP-L-rhamnose 4-epimerase